MKKSLALIDDLIAIEAERDRAHKAAAIKAGKGRQALGESLTLFHLKELRKLVEEEWVARNDGAATSTIPVGQDVTLPITFTLPLPPAGVPNRNGDMFSPNATITLGSNFGSCVDKKFCNL